MLPVAHGMALTRIRRSGPLWSDAAESPIDGAFIAPSAATSADFVLYAPYGLDVIPGDRLRDGNGLLWEVVKARFDWQHPASGWQAGATAQVVMDPLPTLVDRCEIRTPSAWSEAAGQSIETRGAIALQWRGLDQVPCRIQNAEERTDVVVAQQSVVTGALTVTLPWDVEQLLTGLVLHILSASDVSMTGQDLLVESDALASAPLSRVVTVTANIAPTV